MDVSFLEEFPSCRDASREGSCNAPIDNTHAAALRRCIDTCHVAPISTAAIPPSLSTRPSRPFIPFASLRAKIDEDTTAVFVLKIFFALLYVHFKFYF